MKTCVRCAVPKPLTEFHRNVCQIDKLQPACKACHSKRVRMGGGGKSPRRPPYANMQKVLDQIEHATQESVVHQIIDRARMEFAL